MTDQKTSAVILAAGMSTRMGTSKLSLVWGSNTVIGAVCTALHTAGIRDMIVVLGGYSEVVHQALDALPYGDSIKLVINPDPAGAGMLGSVKLGLRAIDKPCQRVLIALGDNPQITTEVVQDLIAEEGRGIVIPSYQHRRGHPWAISWEMVDDLLGLPDEATMRDWINARAEQITYIDAGAEVLMDLDTPEDYERQKP